MFRRALGTLSLLLCSCSLFASHIEGGELRYEFNGVNYTVHLKVYISCSGINPGALPQTINFNSVSCNSSFQRQFALSQEDTIKEMWCPTVAAGCQGSYQPTIVREYTDTVSLSACSDWRIHSTISSLASTMNNMGPNPGSVNPYLEAKLNNATATNSSPFIANHPPFQIDVNTIHTASLQTVDADGDSVALFLKQLPTSSTTSVPFAPVVGPNPYTATHQMGNYTILDNTNQKLILNTSVQSPSMMVMGVEEYRNGLLVGDYTRFWMTRSGVNINSTAPYAVPGTNFSYITLWGQFNSITINFADSTLTDSVFVDFFPPNLNGFTFNSSTTSAPGSGSGTISWSTPNNVSEAQLPHFIIPVRAKNNSCPDQSYTYYGILIDMQQAFPLGLSTIRAANAGSRNQIMWTTDLRYERFEIERSSDGNKFEYLGSIAGKTTSVYTYRDEHPVAGKNYYRLKTKEANGEIRYSSIVSAVLNLKDVPLSFKTYPNPASGMLTFAITGEMNGEASLTISDVAGKVINTMKIREQISTVDLSKVNPGIYFMQYTDDAHNEIIKVVKQ